MLNWLINERKYFDLGGVNKDAWLKTSAPVFLYVVTDNLKHQRYATECLVNVRKYACMEEYFKSAFCLWRPYFFSWWADAAILRLSSDVWWQDARLSSQQKIREIDRIKYNATMFLTNSSLPKFYRIHCSTSGEMCIWITKTHINWI